MQYINNKGWVAGWSSTHSGTPPPPPSPSSSSSADDANPETASHHECVKMSDVHKTVQKWHASFSKGTDFDSWGQLVEAVDEYHM